MPCDGDAREQTPLFVNPDTNKAFTYGEANTILKLMLTVIVGPTRVSLYSWHSFRIYLCTALLNANVDIPVIQALCRWQTDQSIREYGRLTYTSYSGFLSRAAAADTSRTLQGSRLVRPPVDATDVDLTALLHLQPTFNEDD